MSWCDKLASTPTAGLRLDPYVTSGDALFEALAPVINGFIVNDRLGLNVERHDTTGITFITESGYRYAVDHQKLAISFSHRVRAVPTSGGLPELKMLSTPQPYTLLLNDVLERLMEAALLLPEAKNRRIRRIGIVSLTSVAEEDLPPGIKKFIEYVGRPWARELESYSLSIASTLDETKLWRDHCIHTITKPDQPDELMTLNFDWGRNYEEPRILGRPSLKAISEEGREASLRYFEELAEGSRFDERVIRETA